MTAGALASNAAAVVDRPMHYGGDALDLEHVETAACILRSRSLRWWHRLEALSCR